MRNENIDYDGNRAWGDNHMPAVMETILGLMPGDGWNIRETSKKHDMTRAADLILSRGDASQNIGVRVREEYAMHNWPTEFTIRHAYTAGHKTEFDKVVGEGHCDINFYGFVVDEKIIRWLLIDFDEFRNQHEMVEGVLVPKPHLRWSLQKNTNKINDFYAYDSLSFENLDKLILAHSPGYFEDVRTVTMPVVNTVTHRLKKKEDRIDGN